MWFMKAGERVFYIRTDKPEVYIGRSADVCDLVLTCDTSVSRRHAVIQHHDHSLTLQDLGSKYGTYINEDIAKKAPLDKNKTVNLNLNDQVRFGTLENVWTIQKLSLVTCTSTLKGENLEEMKKDLEVIGASLRSEWDATCTHLTMPAITLTAKVLAALAFESHIVTVQFWKAWRQVVTSGGDPPDPSHYLPEIIENTLNKDSVSFAPDARRKELFVGKKFIFFSRKQLTFYKMILEQCGASVALLKDCKLTKSKLCADNIVVVQFNASAPGLESQSQRQVIGDIVNYMAGKSRRVIPDVEIGLAILIISTEKYCNPKDKFLQMFNRSNAESNKNLNPKVLAPETEELLSDKNDHPEVVIEESLVSINNDVSIDASLETRMFSDTIERTKRKFQDTDETNSLEKVSKKPALSGSSLLSKTTDVEIFDFVEAPKTASAAANKSPAKKLNFLKPKNRKNKDSQDDIFNFLPDDDKNKPSSDNTLQSSLFSASGLKRKHENSVLPGPKRAQIENPAPINKPEVKVDFTELSKHSFWKCCEEEIAKHEIKQEIGETEETKIDLGKTVVSVRTDLIVKAETPPPSRNSSYSGPNFKKFKKVLPLKMQITVIPSSSMSLYRPDPPSGQEIEVQSSDDDDERIWTQNTKKQRGRRMIR